MNIYSIFLFLISYIFLLVLFAIVNNLNSEDFPRIRVGIGRPKDEFDRIDYVIGKIDDEEFVNLQNGQDLAVKAVEYWIKNGIDNTMNVYN